MKREKKEFRNLLENSLQTIMANGMGIQMELTKILDLKQ